jgi:hypothetical protein
LVGVVDAATGTEVWSEVVAGTAVEMVAIPGGGVAVIGGVASGTTGVLCLDGTGTTSGELALGPIPMKTGVYKDLTWLAALGSDSVIVGTTEVNLTGSVHLVSTAGELLWSTTVGGAPLFVSRSDSGGAWVVSNYSRPDELPDCLGSGEGGLLHFDKSGQCTAMASSFLGGLGAMRADGLVAILGNNGKGQLAVITQGEAPEDNSFLPFWPEDGSQTGKVAWSPDGTRLVYTFRILQDDVFTDAIGWARF